MRNLLTAFSLILTLSTIAQTIPSPESFLGYKVGDRFTPHHKLMDYFEAVAEAAPARVKLEQYGVTYEGRPLFLTYISSPENMQRLEEIRGNNLKLAGLGQNTKAADVNAPVIVWLSYNVHGNEPSSSEAAMMTLYALTDPKQTQYSNWLKNAVVVIDPCMNPDGRERYVNWFQSTAGVNPNIYAFTREHNEPWPGGRTNHYNFDLNRDWAWQSQAESRQRAKLYLQWMPQVHVDFHEQGFNNPYFFAPAAEPFHEVITDWQREFQTQIGRNNAKYFDQQGWLYFTREQFDLFYPSYGDTYPTYNGAIGMTYEQGGHSRGGLSVKTADGDTLTLADRALHHFTTGMSTIEISSQQAPRLIREFHNYFQEAINTGYGNYGAYVIKDNPASNDRLDELKAMLDRNGIEYGYARRGVTSGFSYFSGKEEKIQLAENDLVIYSRQPRSAMVRVLMEPRSSLRDSVTYDITAWALPYAYGLEAYACKEKVAYTSTATGKNQAKPLQADSYAYAVRWTSKRSAAFLGKLLQAGVRVRYAQEPFSMEGQDFDRGTLLITRAANQQVRGGIAAMLEKLGKEENVDVFSLRSGFSDKGFDIGSDKMRMIRRSNVVVLTGEDFSPMSVGEVWHFFEQELRYPVNMVNASDIGQINWENIDVLVVPNSSTSIFLDKHTGERIKDWVRGGGRLIAMENTVQQLAMADWGIKLKKSDEKDKEDLKKDPYQSLRKYADRERDGVKSGIPGAIYKIDLDNTHPLAFGYPDFYYSLKQSDAIFDYFVDNGWNVGILKKNNYITGFAGSLLKPRLTDGLLTGVQSMGAGEIIYFIEDPLFRSFWENGKLMFCNAVFLVGQ